jgi:hypothetical protein
LQPTSQLPSKPNPSVIRDEPFSHNIWQAHFQTYKKSHETRTIEENAKLQALLYSLTTPAFDRTFSFGTDTERICIDAGASACLSTKKGNFVNLQPVTNLKINGIGSGLPVEGVGTLKWPMQADDGTEMDIHIHQALYVPSAPMGLLCPQQIAMQTQTIGDGFQALGHASILTVAGRTKMLHYDKRSRLPIMFTIDGAVSYNAAVYDKSDNLTHQQQLLLNWHNRLAHLNFNKIQELARAGKLPKSIANCPHPICKSCQFGKAHRRPPAPSTTAPPIDSDDLQPGDKVSVDQIESTTPGFVDVYKGKPTTAKFHAASIYVDHASRFTFIKCHYSTRAAEAIEGKHHFEQLTATHGVKVKAYRADNGIMACHEYIAHVNQNQQSITYCGVNAHGQNGIAE